MPLALSSCYDSPARSKKLYDVDPLMLYLCIVLASHQVLRKMISDLSLSGCGKRRTGAPGQSRPDVRDSLWWGTLKPFCRHCLAILMTPGSLHVDRTETDSIETRNLSNVHVHTV